MKINTPLSNINTSVLEGLSQNELQGFQGFQGIGQDPLKFSNKAPKMIYSYIQSSDGEYPPTYFFGITGHSDFEYYPGDALYLYNADFKIFRDPQYASQDSEPLQTDFFTVERYCKRSDPPSPQMNFEGYINTGIENDQYGYLIQGVPALTFTTLGSFVTYSSLKYTKQDTFIIDSNANPKSVLTTNNVDHPISILFGTYQIGFVDGYYIDGTITFEKAFSDIPKVVASIQDTIILNSLSTKSLVVSQITSTTFSFHLSSSHENDFSNDTSITYFASGTLL